MRFWRNTPVATQSQGQVATLAPNTLGYEFDEDLDNGARPDGIVRMSTTTQTVQNRLVDPDIGNHYSGGVATHHLTLHRAGNALVFGAGTVQWAWGLEGSPDGTAGVDVRMQQATINVLADMGVQPSTLITGLVAASASSDSTPPSSIITTPTSGLSVPAGSAINIMGTANDSGGGVVGGVEVSIDGGQSWHAVSSGRASWMYQWQPLQPGSYNLLSRAVDDSANLGVPSNPVSVTVTPRNCPCSIWPSNLAPVNASDADATAIEIGVKFFADLDGTISGIRFYKSTTNTGTHVASLWTANGQLLARATFSAESASGWQQVNFASPVNVTAGTHYVASYHSNVGHYAGDNYYFFNSGFDNPPLHALKSGVDGGNGVYIYSANSAFPTNTYQASNYWVDVVFTPGSSKDTSPPTVTSRSPAPNSTGVPVSTSVSAKFSEPVQQSSIVFTLNNGSINVPATLTYSNSTFTATLTPNAALSASTTYTATLSGAKDAAGNTMGVVTWSFTTAASTSSNCPCTIWPSGAVPVLAADSDTNSIEVGLKFRADINGFITGLRFYKSSTNTGPHVASLWSATGALLAQATSTNESASGWQQVNFASPVAITAGTTYVASYHANNGHYAGDTGYFANTGVDNTPLHALKDGSDGANGVYIYNANPTFPTQAFQSTNYWVDVVFDTTASDSTPPSLTNRSPAPNAVGVPVNTTATATFSEPVQQSTITFTLKDVNNNAVTASVSYNSSTFTATLAPNSALAASTTYTATVSGAKDNAGNTMSTVSWSFTTAAAQVSCPCSIWPATAAPTVAADSDTNSIEVGLKFRADINGKISAIRFYKSSTNTGTHVASLWKTDGTLLAQATFTNETTSGWQQVNFPTPVAITAGTTYIASYHAPRGHYPDDIRFFANSAVDNGPLHALKDGVDGANGVYSYSANSVMPTKAFQASNYWVDVVFTSP
jgi:hypothetical protein